MKRLLLFIILAISIFSTLASASHMYYNTYYSPGYSPYPYYGGYGYYPYYRPYYRPSYRPYRPYYRPYGFFSYSGFSFSNYPIWYNGDY